MTLKTKKELAFLHELFVATDWGERFAELIEKHVKLPKEGRALYVASGTGSDIIALQERAGKNLTFLGVDESEEMLALAREKAKTVLKDGFEFRVERVDSLRLANAHFNLVIGDGSLVHSERIPEMLRELARVAAPGAVVALVLPSFSSFGEFFSIYWEALHNLALMDHERDVESLISVLPSVSQLEALAEQAGLENINTTTQIEEFNYESADAFLAAPLVADFLMPIWLETLPPDSQQRVIDEIGRIVSEETQSVAFVLTLKATLLTGEKALAH